MVPEKISNYFLKISTFNANHLLVEAPQCSPAPFLIQNKEADGKQYIYFLEYFHLQFPLDNLEDRSYIVMELYENINPEGKLLPATKPAPQPPGGPTGVSTASNPDLLVKGWGKFILDRMNITSERVTVKFNLSPFGMNASQVTMPIDLVITKR